MSETEKGNTLPHVTFHVVNSVKGGSGKSTVSLLLAASIESNPNHKAYIIDLDINGTSWNANYKNILQFGRSGGGETGVPNSMRIFLNDLMLDYEGKSTQGIFARLPILVPLPNATEPTQQKFIEVCLANPDVQEDINEVELDLFENTIYKIVRQIYSSNTSRSMEQSLEHLHIILDMPPSYEQHAEKILNHLLLDSSSELVKSVEKKEDPFDTYEPYKVDLIMLSAISMAHVEHNKKYIISLLRNQKISSRLLQLIKENRFIIRFWLNCVNVSSDYLKENDTILRDSIKATLDIDILPRSKFPGLSEEVEQMLKSMEKTYFAWPHLDDDWTMQAFSASWEDSVKLKSMIPEGNIT